MKLKVIESKNTNVYYNLAIEENLLNNFNKEIFLFFWKSKNSIVIGKHQNPWREINFEKIEDINIARRVSGGGTVYHDLGNLNYSVIASKNLLTSEIIFEIILKALKSIGINAYKNYKNDLMYKDYKFSGSAFCIKKNMFLHHGTLLINSDIQKIKDVLNINPIFETHATISKPSKIINLREINFCIDEEMIKNNIILNFSRFLNMKYEYIQTKYFRNEELIEKHKSWEWIYGKTPRFTLNIGNKKVLVENGYINNECKFNLNELYQMI
ncbi:lipoate--protein ligase family protein [Marinitoga lauensis]|uniref:lipoate--protein ligase family protein n=1 Tax=Marinitoga lauensis TaxID=2201189 RepID=UPI0010123120|nr:lipoate--protein ligase family protein [Marinitoga lauensis]